MIQNRKQELLTLLQEEASEVIQAVSKLMRFEDKDRDNTGAIEQEIGDFLVIVNSLFEEKYLNQENVKVACDKKAKKMMKYTKFKKENVNVSKK